MYSTPARRMVKPVFCKLQTATPIQVRFFFVCTPWNYSKENLI
ncbi:hypothetical protein HMPREF9554_00569 [Treponema phagedenis F0421]|nr:hypothetical protein HMPREF9554_00569 [Treponema phagedenis F0421]